MTKEQYLSFHEACCKKMVEITKVKNADYTGSTNDPFANFRLCELLDIATTEQGFLTRMTDKLSRINSFRQKGDLQVRDESVEDTLLDLANYCILMAGYLRSQRRGALADFEPLPVDNQGRIIHPGTKIRVGEPL